MLKAFLYCILLQIIAISPIFSQEQSELIDYYSLIIKGSSLIDEGDFETAIENFNQVPYNDTNYTLAQEEILSIN